MYCSRCGQENPGAANFCMNCGTSLTGRPPNDSSRDAQFQLPVKVLDPHWEGTRNATVSIRANGMVLTNNRGTTAQFTFRDIKEVIIPPKGLFDSGRLVCIRGLTNAILGWTLECENIKQAEELGARINAAVQGQLR